MKLAILKMFTVMWLLGMYIVLVWTFMAAYQSPHKAVSIMINNYNEAQAEFYMLLGSLIPAFLGAIFILSDIRNEYAESMSQRLE
jgi:hypothetical protein